MENIVSEVQVVPISPRDGLVGFATLVLYNQIYLGSIAIFTRPRGGYRLVYPTKKLGDRNANIFFPINKQIAELIEEVVLSKFEEVINNVRHNSNYGK